MALGILYGHAMEGWHDDYACEIRYRDVRERLRDMSERIAQVEQDQRTFVDLLRDVRELIRRVAARLQALEHCIEEIARRSERMTRHFRN
jgi:small-conductance mechanosensitive channel